MRVNIALSPGRGRWRNAELHGESKLLGIDLKVMARKREGRVVAGVDKALAHMARKK